MWPSKYDILSVILKFIFPLSCSQFFNVFQYSFTLGQSTNKCLIDSIACSQKEHLLLSILLISFTMAKLNSFWTLYEILPTAQENKCLRNFSYFVMKLYVGCTH